MTSPDPTLPEVPSRGAVAREVAGLLLMLLGAIGMFVMAYDVDRRLAGAFICLVIVFIGWRLTAAEE